MVKLALAFAAASALIGVTSAQDRVGTALPVQTFFVSMPEELVFQNSFLPIRKGQTFEAKSPIVSVVSFAVSVNETVIWYDHWEDGFDADITNPSNRSSTTEVWGDRNAKNGCPPGVKPCTDANDVLEAGKSYVAENKVPVPRKKSNILYDGGDKVQASYNIAVTRGQYPEYPGAYMAGAVEVYDTNSWGYTYEMPLGQKLSSASFDGTNGQKRLGDAFEISTVFLMAHEDDTIVTKPDGKNVTLGMGETLSIAVDMGDVFTSTKKLQAALATADKGSAVELRWFSLLSTDQWSKSYLAPVGDTSADIRVVMYNKADKEISVQVKTPTQSYTKKVPGKSATWTDTVKDNEGALLTSSSDFIALTIVDTAYKGSNNHHHQGSGQDWGFPVIPTDQLSSQVLIGWGYGCSGNNCTDTKQTNSVGKAIKDTFFSRTLVFVSPIEDCVFYVDFENDGMPDKTIDAKALSSHKISDNKDQDMTGAIIWATKPKTGPTGAAVDFSAAWGQDPNAIGGDAEAMDLGTVVLPFDLVRVTEVVELADDLDKNGVISPGDILKYTIRVQNTGQLDIPVNDLTITGPILAENLKQRTYVKGTCLYDNTAGKTRKCADDSLGSVGLKNPYVLKKRGGYHDITFKAKIHSADKIISRDLPQGGILTQTNRKPLPFSAPTMIQLVFQPQTLQFNDASIKIEKTVHHDTQARCSNGQEMAHGYKDDPVTFCYKVTNTGATHLNDIRVTDRTIGFGARISGILAPGDSSFAAPFPSTITSTQTTTATTLANPVDANGNDLIGMSDVRDDDDAGVMLFAPMVDVYCAPDDQMNIQQKFGIKSN